MSALTRALELAHTTAENYRAQLTHHADPVAEDADATRPRQSPPT